MLKKDPYDRISFCNLYEKLKSRYYQVIFPHGKNEVEFKSFNQFF
jgi:hypothetical protein